MRGCETSSTVMPLLNDRAGARRPEVLLRADERAARRRVLRVQDAHRDAPLDRRLDRRGVQHLGAEVGELRRLVGAEPAG